MSDTKRWSVTYTKHVRQKRKVYQDGFLELQSSRHKVMLYDELDKLLESRFLKKDDVIKCGETLTFEGYLVDIAEPCGDRKPDLDKGKGFQEDHSSPNRKPIFRKAGGRLAKLSPSQKMIRDFKKAEINKLVSSPSFINVGSSSPIEWQVLYTSHITQKAKKFHDGFLKLVFHGSEGRQVMLSDANRMHLNSRFLKKDEIVSAGKSLAFDGYLVDIGESHAEDCKLIPKSTARGEISKRVGKNIISSEQVRVRTNKIILVDAEDNAPESCFPNHDDPCSVVLTPKNFRRNAASEPRRAVYDILSSLRQPIQKKADGLNQQMLETCAKEYAVECFPSAQKQIRVGISDIDGRIEVSKQETGVIATTNKSRSLDSEHLTQTQSPVLIKSNQNEKSERAQEFPVAGIRTDINTVAANYFSSSGLPETCEVKGSTSTLHQAASSNISAATNSLNNKCSVEEKNLNSDDKKEMDEFPSFDLGF